LWVPNTKLNNRFPVFQDPMASCRISWSSMAAT
jgi:hypothetical protein